MVSYYEGCYRHGSSKHGGDGMASMSVIDALNAINDEFIISTDLCSDAITECMRLRYEVYCMERGFLPGRGGLEYDEFDECSRHVALWSRGSGDLIGTVRMVLPVTGQTAARFPDVACVRSVDPVTASGEIHGRGFALRDFKNPAELRHVRLVAPGSRSRPGSFEWRAWSDALVRGHGAQFAAVVASDIDQLFIGRPAGRIPRGAAALL